MKYILGVLGVIILTILAVILIVSRNPNTPDSSTKNITPTISILDYSERVDSWVSIKTDGRIVGQDEHRAIRITVSNTERVIDVLKGYDETVISTKAYPNNQDAYETFLHTLNTSGFLKSRKIATTADERGACPTGFRYMYELHDGVEEKSRLWGTSCSTSEGNFAGNASLTRQLFQAQIPDYNKFVSGVTL